MARTEERVRLEEHPQASPVSQEHLSIEILSAYHRRVLPAAASARVRRHVVSCAECRDLLLDLARFLEDREGFHHRSPDEVVAAWRKLRRSAAKNRTG